MIKIEMARPVITMIDATADMSEKESAIARKLFHNEFSVVKDERGIRVVKGMEKGSLYGCEAVIAYMESLGLKPMPIRALDVQRILALANSIEEAEDLLCLLRRVDMKNDSLRRLMEMGAPGIILMNQYRLLREAVECLFFNSAMPHPVSYPDEDSKERARVCVMDLVLREDTE